MTSAILPLGRARALVEEQDAGDDRDDGVRRRRGRHDGRVRVADAEVERDVAERIDDRDQGDHPEQARGAVGEAPLTAAERDRHEKSVEKPRARKMGTSQPYSALKYATP